MIKKWIKHHIIYVVCFMSFIVLLGFPLFLNWLAKILKQFGFVAVGGTSTWISFYGSYIGSIVGGILTLGGVLITLKFTRNQLKEEKRLATLPYLRPTISVLPSNYEVIQEPILFATSLLDNIYDKIKLHIELENIGLGSAIEVSLEFVGNIINDIYVMSSIKKDEKVKFYCELDEDLIDNTEDMTMIFSFKDLHDNCYEQHMTILVYKKTNDMNYNVFLQSYDSPKIL